MAPRQGEKGEQHEDEAVHDSASRGCWVTIVNARGGHSFPFFFGFAKSSFFGTSFGSSGGFSPAASSAARLYDASQSSRGQVCGGSVRNEPRTRSVPPRFC